MQLNAADYQHNPDRLRNFLTAHNLTGAAAGQKIGVDGRTIRRWTAQCDTPSSRDMPYSAWYALHHIVTGKVPMNAELIGRNNSSENKS